MDAMDVHGNNDIVDGWGMSELIKWSSPNQHLAAWCDTSIIKQGIQPD